MALGVDRRAVRPEHLSPRVNERPPRARRTADWVHVQGVDGPQQGVGHVEDVAGWTADQGVGDAKTVQDPGARPVGIEAIDRAGPVPFAILHGAEPEPANQIDIAVVGAIVRPVRLRIQAQGERAGPGIENADTILARRQEPLAARARSDGADLIVHRDDAVGAARRMQPAQPAALDIHPIEPLGARVPYRALAQDVLGRNGQADFATGGRPHVTRPGRRGGLSRQAVSLMTSVRTSTPHHTSPNPRYSRAIPKRPTSGPR